MTCRMDFVPLNCAMMRINAREGDIFAEVISSINAKKAAAARDTWLNSNSVS